MIKDQFLYFAQYPSRDGVLAMFTNGSSDFPGYNDLVASLRSLPNESRVPEIANYVYGQSFDELKLRIDKLVGPFLFVDYGEVDMLGDGRNSYQCTQRMAVTVANKMPNHADAAEYMLASDTTLRLLSRGNLDKAEIVPFVATELHSVGWTLMMSCEAPDSLGTHGLYRSFVRRLQ